ncbi:MAG: hypothetical protein ACQKBY_03430, partial [Verrucomicrobiales bacterium]
RSLAREFSAYPDEAVEGVELITSFRPDYGFIQKRLPVLRVNYRDQEYWHYTVDPADAHLAQRMSAEKLQEALIFLNIHKWHFWDRLFSSGRDLASALAAGSLVLVVISGLVVASRRRSR